MGTETLTAIELVSLISRVFQPGPEDTSLAILMDIPDDELPDTEDWKKRRTLAAGWAAELEASQRSHGLSISLLAYPNVRSNNADLPVSGWRIDPDSVPDHVREMDPQPAVDFVNALAQHRLVLAPTELSTTAPLKMLAPRHGFRAATMPGFSAQMVPALRLDYTEIDRRVRLLTSLLDRSDGADLQFEVDGSERLELHLDLRHRTAHASGGLLPEPGTAGNLPSGEAYIVPYEGELEGDATGSRGRLPIQLGDEVVVFRIENNVVAGVESTGPTSQSEAARIEAEPAAGNLAELGLGVLSDFGIEPIGEVLLDEKLGLHIALGRSEHFGGQVGPKQFTSPDAVVHQDYVYLEQLQPRVRAAAVDLTLDDGSAVELIRDGDYVVRF
jgi:hypothetical protein